MIKSWIAGQTDAHCPQESSIVGLIATLADSAPWGPFSKVFWYSGCVKFAQYFLEIRKRPDRETISDEWLERAITTPIREAIQADGRIRRWVKIDEMEGRYLRVVLLADGKTVHNAFFDRRFEP